ncbi:GGDEF domain-containing protein [Eubacterium limosum]|uniref:GGDEF domain-containing protein n=1 Tax=Eubacterium limosum TaxID=1736 RepID=UPI001063375D|nr:GGDEF domain-containing protein [Eubacterium limosum]
MFKIKDSDTMLRNLIDQSAAAFFDQYRFVTPADYCVYNCKNACLEAEDIPCYAIWQRDTPCHNCSSIRALSLKEPVIKLEYLENKVFLILSTPHTVDGRRCVLELAKDVTASLMINDDRHCDNTIITDVIAELNNLSVRDLYTGLYNKNYAEREVSRCISDKKSFTAAMMDIDDFKIINDTYGHQTGDIVLREMAALLTDAASNGNGWAARIGGDEFILILPELSMEQAEPILFALSRDIKEHLFYKGDSHFSVNASMGIKEYHPGEMDAADFFDQVDMRMYEEKRRNKSGR